MIKRELPEYHPAKATVPTTRTIGQNTQAQPPRALAVERPVEVGVDALPVALGKPAHPLDGQCRLGHPAPGDDRHDVGTEVDPGIVQPVKLRNGSP